MLCRQLNLGVYPRRSIFIFHYRVFVTAISYRNLFGSRWCSRFGVSKWNSHNWHDGQPVRTRKWGIPIPVFFCRWETYCYVASYEQLLLSQADQSFNASCINQIQHRRSILSCIMQYIIQYNACLRWHLFQVSTFHLSRGLVLLNAELSLRLATISQWQERTKSLDITEQSLSWVAVKKPDKVRSYNEASSMKKANDPMQMPKWEWYIIPRGKRMARKIVACMRITKWCFERAQCKLFNNPW